MSEIENSQKENRKSSVDFEIVRPANLDELFTMAGQIVNVSIAARDYLLNVAYRKDEHREIMDAVGILRECTQDASGARGFTLAVKWLPERAA